MEELFRQSSQKIKIYLAVTSQEDPYERNDSLAALPSLPISAIVTDLAFAKIQWAMPGISCDQAKEIIIEKKNKSLLEQSYKIEIEGFFYEGWKVNGKMQTKQECEFLRCYIYIKKI